MNTQTMEKKKAVNLRMKPSLIDDIKRTADSLDVTISHLIRTAVKNYIAQVRQTQETRNEQ